MGFSNAVVGGVGKLIRSWIQSPNYVAGQTGWTINKDGSAEFNVSTIRGKMIITDNSGNVICTIDNTGIKLFDPSASEFLTALLNNKGLTVSDPSGAKLVINHDGTNGTFINLTPPPPPGGYPGIDAIVNGYIQTGLGGSGPLYKPQLQIQGPSVSTGGDIILPATMTLEGDDTDNTGGAVRFTGKDISFSGLSLARGVVGTHFSKAGTLLSSSGTEVALGAWDSGSDGGIRFVGNRIYELTCSYGYYDNWSNESYGYIVRIREGLGSTASTQLGYFKEQGTLAASNVFTNTATTYVMNSTNVDKIITPGITIQRVAGTGSISLYGDANIPVMIVTKDIGLAADHSGLFNSAVVL